jgi:hypothetical protein
MMFLDGKLEGGEMGNRREDEVPEDSSMQQESRDPSRFVQISSSSCFYVLYDPSSVPYLFFLSSYSSVCTQIGSRYFFCFPSPFLTWMLAGVPWGHIYIGKNPTFFGGIPKGFSRWK